MEGVWSDAKIAESLSRFAAEHLERGHSKWAAFTREGDFVGRAGVSLWPATGELELGCAFAHRFWGQGLATEAARAVADWTFANTDVAHPRSPSPTRRTTGRSVLERIGMTPGRPRHGLRRAQRLFRDAAAVEPFWFRGSPEPDKNSKSKMWA